MAARAASFAFAAFRNMALTAAASVAVFSTLMFLPLLAELMP